MRDGTMQPVSVSTRGCELNFAETIETVGMHIILEIPRKNKISSDLQHVTRNASNGVVFANRIFKRNKAA